MGVHLWLSGGAWGPLPDRALIPAGALYAPAVASGELWRLATAPWLHRSWVHLAGNLVGLAGVVALGRGASIRTFALGGAAGAAASYALGVVMSVGASGGVFALGAEAAARALREEDPASGRGIALGLVAAGALSALLPGVDIAAHAGGALAGAALGALTPGPARRTGRTPPA